MSILNTEHLSPITDLEKLDKLDEILSWAVRHQIKPRWSIEITLFKLPEWVAVPVISESFITPIVQEQLQQTFMALGYSELFAVILFSKGFPAYRVPITIEGLMELRQKMVSCCYALFAGESEPDWAIISIESEVDVIAGSSDFVRQVLGCEIEEGFSRFQNFTMHEPMPKQLRKYLHHVHDCLKDNYQSAAVGAEFRLSF